MENLNYAKIFEVGGVITFLFMAYYLLQKNAFFAIDKMHTSAMNAYDKLQTATSSAFSQAHQSTLESFSKLIEEQEEVISKHVEQEKRNYEILKDLAENTGQLVSKLAVLDNKIEHIAVSR